MVEKSKGIVAIAVLFLFLLLVLCHAQVVDETRFMVQLNERLELNKAEILKEVKISTEASKTEIKANMDDNFKVLDERLDTKLQNNNRNFAVILIAGFISSFVLSQIIRLQVERIQRRALIGQIYRLEQKNLDLTRRFGELSKSLEVLGQKEQELYSKITSYKASIMPIGLPFGKMAILGVLFAIIGAGVAFVALRVL